MSEPHIQPGIPFTVAECGQALQQREALEQQQRKSEEARKNEEERKK